MTKPVSDLLQSRFNQLNQQRENTRTPVKDCSISHGVDVIENNNPLNNNNSICNSTFLEAYNVSVCTDGAIYGATHNKLTQRLNAYDYLEVAYYKRSAAKYTGSHVTVHRLVALAYVPNPKKKRFIIHKDDNRLNNHYTNLAWATKTEMDNHNGTGRHHGKELPKDVVSLISLSYINKFKKLNAEHQKELAFLANYALTNKRVRNPVAWFRKCCSLERWASTLEWIGKAMKSVPQIASEIAQRIGATPEQMKPILKACWRLGTGAIRHAITAQETAKTTKFKYFCWLTRSTNNPS